MKPIKSAIIILLGFLLTINESYAQAQQDTSAVRYRITKQNGASFVGKILSRDAREILVETNDVGLVYIPKHEIDKITEIKSDEDTEQGGLFATRYFLTTNGFNINKGDNYVQWNLFGPDFQFGVADNFTLGVMTSWVGIPIIGTAKYGGRISDKLYGGAGFLGGTGSWAFPEYGLALPFGFITRGDRTNNINLTAGYGLIFTEKTETTYTILPIPTEYSINSYESSDKTYTDRDGRFMFSLAAMFRINDKFSFVFDSFYMVRGKDNSRQELQSTWNNAEMKEFFSLTTITEESEPILVLSPGIRFQATQKGSFQFGFLGVRIEGEFLPVPFPMVQWFRRI